MRAQPADTLLCDMTRIDRTPSIFITRGNGPLWPNLECQGLWFLIRYFYLHIVEPQYRGNPLCTSRRISLPSTKT